MFRSSILFFRYREWEAAQQLFASRLSFRQTWSYSGHAQVAEPALPLLCKAKDQAAFFTHKQDRVKKKKGLSVEYWYLFEYISISSFSKTEYMLDRSGPQDADQHQSVWLQRIKNKTKHTLVTFIHFIYTLILKEVNCWILQPPPTHPWCMSSCSVTCWKYIHCFLKAASPTTNLKLPT